MENYIKNVSKRFDKTQALKNISFDIKEGELLTILGPSGCGKSTLLRIIAGITTSDSGEVVINGQTFSSDKTGKVISPEKRNIGFVFQNYSLWPHKSIFDNIAYPLKLRKTSKKIIREKVYEMLKMVKLRGNEKRFPYQLSGGEQQRVAFARALIANPSLLLLDEPLSNLDAKLREQMQYEIKKIQKTLNITTIHVTHDQSEALSMSDRIAVMNSGNLIQLDTPYNVYSNPANEFVASFIGKTNFIHSDENLFSEKISEFKKGTERLSISVRPEDLFLSPDNGDESGRIISEKYKGESIEYIVEVHGKEFTVKADKNTFYHKNQNVFISLKNSAFPMLKCS